MFKVSERIQISGIAFVVAVAIFVAFGELSQAQFTSDDWHYFALLRHIDSPVDLFTSNIAGAYFYRPNALFLFWLSATTFGVDPVAHYSINVALHAWVALEVFALATLVTKSRLVSAWAGVFFLLLPATSATALWVSDRFDLLATAAMLCSLRLMIEWTKSGTPRHGVLLGALTMALLAIGSKETAFALFPALLLTLFVHGSRSNRSRLLAGAAVILLGLIAISSRVAALNGWTGTESLSLNASVIGAGSSVWLANLPFALQTHNSHLPLVGLGLVAFASLLSSCYRSSAGQRIGVASHIAILLILLLGTIAAQSPIALTALPQAGAEVPTVSLRFFYTPLAVLFIIAVGLFSHFPPKGVLLVWALRICVVLALVTATLGSALQSRTWTKNTIAETQLAAPPIAEYASMAKQIQDESPCLVRLPSAARLTDLDLRFKASLATSDRRMNCALLTQPPQAQTITRIRNCQGESLLPARSTIASVKPWPRSGTCTFFFLVE